MDVRRHNSLGMKIVRSNIFERKALSPTHTTDAIFFVLAINDDAQRYFSRRSIDKSQKLV